MAPDGSRVRRRSELSGLAAGQRHLHRELTVVARQYDEYAGLFSEIPIEAHGVCHAVPGLDANEWRAGFAPEAQVGCIWKLQAEPKACIRSVTQALTAKGGQDHGVVLEQLVVELQSSCMNWRWISDRHHGAGRIQAANRLGLLEVEFDGVECASSAKRQRPAKRRVIAKARGHRRITVISHRGRHYECRAPDLEAHLKLKVKRIYG